MDNYVEKLLACKSVADVKEYAKKLYTEIGDEKVRAEILSQIQKAISDRNGNVASLFQLGSGSEIIPAAREATYLTAAYRILGGNKGLEKK